MITFDIVRRIGEGHYLDEEPFIIERARKVRALGAQRLRPEKLKYKTGMLSRDGKHGSS